MLNLQTVVVRERDYAGCHGNEATHARSEDVDTIQHGHGDAIPHFGDSRSLV